MQIKSSLAPSRLDQLLRTLRQLRLRGWLLVGYSVLLLGAGVVVHRTGVLGGVKSLLTRRTLTETIRRVKGWLTVPEHLTIDIPHQDFMALAEKRDGAVARGILQVSEADFVNADIRHNGRTVPVQLRLKGDLVDHLDGNKWSFRVVTRQDSTVLGMRQFSLHHPKARIYAYEKLYHELVRREGLIALRYEFVDLTVNGKALGIYALEEHFERALVEHSRRPDGPIVRFSEDTRWAELAAQPSTPVPNRTEVAGAGDFLAAEVDAFQTSRWLRDSVGRGHYLTAVHLLEAFRRGQIPTSEAFDRKKLATFFALTDLLGAWHGAGHWTNARFAFNPTSSRLEPVAFDGFDRVLPTDNRLLGARALKQQDSDDHYLALLFADRAFYLDYIAELERVSDPAYLKEIIPELTPILDRSLRVLHREFPSVEFSWQPIHRRAEFVRVALHPPKAVHAYLESKQPGNLDLRVGNMQIFPIIVLGLTRDSVRFGGFQSVELAGRPDTQAVAFHSVAAPVPRGFSWPDTLPAPLRILYQVAGTSRPNAADVFPWAPEGIETAVSGAIHQGPNAHTFAFLAVEEKQRQIRIKPGTWTIDRNLILPAGYQVHAGPGTTLDLRNGASVVSRSPLQFVGEPEAPVIVRSTDSTGRGVFVVQAGGTSRLQHTRFEGLASAQEAGWTLTGAVTFYESPVDIARSHWSAIRAEDALHIVRARFALEEVSFEDSAADAVDIDFGQGVIRSARITRSGKHAIDLTGSSVEALGVEVRGSGDEAVSVGENSRLTGRDITLQDAVVGIASTDFSTVELTDVRLSGGRIGLAAYRKKIEFGPARIVISRLQMSGPLPNLIETGSSATVDGRAFPGNRSHVADSLSAFVNGKRGG